MSLSRIKTNRRLFVLAKLFGFYVVAYIISSSVEFVLEPIERPGFAVITGLAALTIVYGFIRDRRDNRELFRLKRTIFARLTDQVAPGQTVRSTYDEQTILLVRHSGLGQRQHIQFSILEKLDEVYGDDRHLHIGFEINYYFDRYSWRVSKSLTVIRETETVVGQMRRRRYPVKRERLPRHKESLSLLEATLEFDSQFADLSELQEILVILEEQRYVSILEPEEEKD